MTKALQVAIDGPASAGKSTVAKLVAKKFGYVYCDTGAMYRAITLAALQDKIILTDSEAVTKLAQKTKISFKPGDPVQQVFIGTQNITDAIRQPDITNNVSTVAAIASVRTELVNQQRQIADKGNIVMDGRDIGTTVLPHAGVKIFLVASAHERAVRRYKENIAKGINTPLDQLQAEIELRDKKDSTRAVSPLTQAADAQLLDTTSLSIDEVVNKISEIITKKQDELS
ncbi:(d)CMP kinase [Paucilactobacillus suebicus]|uniref:Cytidylate kinase n=1 Tax=Paucilactobacillus suebicus DSM 5007 = KCTC 3549 TaxID=1423807 RepID=A0A0R1W2N6_9LACO|nr:(d)CMP kinase [Paucilactobacillus suebicus]KRM12112.1 cytidylate kinase [Paucilactobacillus suebicus DSM 5007 = KCTC 3549]